MTFVRGFRVTVVSCSWRFSFRDGVFLVIIRIKTLWSTHGHGPTTTPPSRSPPPSPGTYCDSSPPLPGTTNGAARPHSPPCTASSPHTTRITPTPGSRRTSRTARTASPRRSSHTSSAPCTLLLPPAPRTRRPCCPEGIGCSRHTIRNPAPQSTRHTPCGHTASASGCHLQRARAAAGSAAPYSDAVYSIARCLARQRVEDHRQGNSASGTKRRMACPHPNRPTPPSSAGRECRRRVCHTEESARPRSTSAGSMAAGRPTNRAEGPRSFRWLDRERLRWSRQHRPRSTR